jgi:putative ABC transport system ATP-binding protein
MESNSPAIVEVREAVRNYQLGKITVQALKGVSFSLQAREFTALIGPSGSGKSTLLSLIGCISAPDKGTVLIDGRPTTDLDETQKSNLRNECIGFVFQSFNLVPVLNAYENVELPLLINKTIAKKNRHDLIMEALRDVGILDFWRHKPDTLSGGQRQRVAVARALVTKPKLVLADEPTANLDSKTGHNIIDLMLKLNEEKGTTFLFSTHDEKLISRVTRRIHIQDGLIVCG